MSRSESSKYQASLTIEELFEQPYHQQQKWLLTYLDVFVLIIMLVITLLAISEFETSQPVEILATNKKTPPPVKTDIYSTPSKEVKTSPKNININKTSPTKSPPTQAIQSIEQHLISVADSEKDKENKPIANNQQSDDSLQQQLTKTVEELGLIDAVTMKVTRGYAQLEIQDKILFKSSNAILLTAGGTLLKKLVPLLKQSSGLIYIEGHTDNRPIKTAKFPSNWELGAARATSVLHFLTSQKLVASRLRAMTYGDTKPIADNSTKQGREKNRRVSLVIKVSDKID